MRRIVLISGIVLSSIAVCGGVGAMVAKKPVLQSSLQTKVMEPAEPVEEFPLPKGHIVAIDDHAGQITIRHKGVRRYEIPAQTCVFVVGDRALLTGLTPGDKIRFDLQRESGRYVVTHIENSN